LDLRIMVISCCFLREKKEKGNFNGSAITDVWCDMM
jgi:hypothetical protein